MKLGQSFDAVGADQIEAAQTLVGKHQNRANRAQNGDILEDQRTRGESGEAAQVAGGKLGEQAGGTATVVTVAMGLTRSAGAGITTLGLNGPADGADRPAVVTVITVTGAVGIRNLEGDGFNGAQTELL